jgi:hypothetical protein
VIKLTASSAFLVAALFFLAAPISSAATTSGWGSIAGIAVGASQATVIAQHGPDSSPSCAGQQGCLDYHVYGKVAVVFVRNKVASVSCGSPALGGLGCPAGFVLPDGVALGTAVAPSGRSWHGYANPKQPAGIDIDMGGPAGESTWSKSLRVGSRRVSVVLGVMKGKVVSIGYLNTP